MKTIGDWYDSSFKVPWMTKGGMIMSTVLILGMFGVTLAIILGFREVAEIILAGMFASMIILILLSLLPIPQKK